MLNVALTGNVAAGKTTVVAWFAAWGATVIDADELVREAQAPGSATLEAIARLFGTEVIRRDGSLDRDALRTRVMGDDEALASLNAIVHPVVRGRRAELATEAAARGDCILMNEIPLLFEVLDPDAFDLVILVDAPVDVRRERLMSTRGLSRQDADRLIRSQLPSERKRIQSDIVIDNTRTLEVLEFATREVWRRLRARAARVTTSDGQPLLAVFAHRGDEAFTIGGTLARYADAGIETHLVCATDDERMSGQGTRVLGVASVTVLHYARGALRREEVAGEHAVGEVLRRVAPGAVITFGPESGAGEDDHIAVHAWTRNAWVAAGAPCPLYYVAYPEGIAQRLPGGLRGTTEERLAARLDVRPWQDVKHAALAAYERLDKVCDLVVLSTPPLQDREWYTAERPPGRLLVDLYETRSSAVDSPRAPR